MSSRRAIIVIPANVADKANERADEVAAALGLPTFSVGLVERGTAGPVTHYWCNWALTQDQWDAIQTRWNKPPLRGEGIYDADVWTPQQVLDDLNLDRVPFEGP